MIASARAGRNGNSLDDAGPAQAERVGPGPRAPLGTAVLQPIAQEIDQKAWLLAAPFAVLDVARRVSRLPG